MDPFTICTTVASLVKNCGTAATTCHGLLSKYKNAPQLLASIRTECATIKTALSYVDWLVKRDTELLSSQLKAHSPLAETLDVALTGCAVTFSLLDIELQKLYDKSKDQDGYKWRDKMRYVWDEDRAKNILDHMRGLNSAVSLVLTALQTSSLSALGPLLQDQKFVIERVKQDTRSIRESRSSQVGLIWHKSSKSYSDFNSNIGDEEFSFEHEIVNSSAYRNAIKRLALKSKKGTQQSAKPGEPHILDQPLIDLEEPPQSQKEPGVKPNAISTHPCLTPISKCIHTDLLSDAIVEDLKSLLPTSAGSPSQQTNARPADVEYRAPIGESSVNASDNPRENNGDVEKVTSQCFSYDMYREARNPHELPRTPLRGLDPPSPRSSPSPRISADALDSFGKDDISPMTMHREICSLDITRRSILSKKTETQSSPWVKRRGGTHSVSQQAAREVVSSSPRIPISVSGGLAPSYSNVSCLNLEPLFNEEEPDYVTGRLRRRVERDICYKPEDEEYSNTDSEIDRKERTSTDTATYNEKQAPRKKHREQHRRRDVAAEGCAGGILTAAALKQHERRYSSSIHKIDPILRKQKYQRRDVAAGGCAGGILTAAALKQHERRYSSSNHEIDPILPKQKHRRRPVKDHIQDSYHDAALLSNSVPGGGDVVASNSIHGKPRLLETVEKAVRRLIMPTLETLKQEQRTKLNELNHPDSTSSDGNAPRAEFAHKLSKHSTAPDPSGDIYAFTNRDEKNPYVCAEDDLAMDVSRRTDRTSYRVPEDGSPITIPTKKRRDSRDKGRESALTHASHHSQTSLLIEYFEGKKGSNVHSRPCVRVRRAPSAARKTKDTNEHVQVTASKGSRKPCYIRRISLGPHSIGETDHKECGG